MEEALSCAFLPPPQLLMLPLLHPLAPGSLLQLIASSSQVFAFRYCFTFPSSAFKPPSALLLINTAVILFGHSS